MKEDVYDFNHVYQYIGKLNIQMHLTNDNIGKLAERMRAQEECIKTLQAQVANLRECHDEEDEELGISDHIEKIVDHLNEISDLVDE